MGLSFEAETLKNILPGLVEEILSRVNVLGVSKNSGLPTDDFFRGLCFKLLSYEKTSHRPGFSRPVCFAIVNCSNKFSTVRSVN